jgi:hypothetical protein
LIAHLYTIKISVENYSLLSTGSLTVKDAWNLSQKGDSAMGRFSLG